MQKTKFAKNCPKKEKAAKLLEQAQIHANDTDNALKCILVMYLCGNYILITMLNLYN